MEDDGPVSSTAADPVLPPPVLRGRRRRVRLRAARRHLVGQQHRPAGGSPRRCRRGHLLHEKRTRAFRDTVATVTDQPVRTLVNTHHHGDHTHGNWLFGGATVVGHEATRRVCWPPASRATSRSGRPSTSARSCWSHRSSPTPTASRSGSTTGGARSPTWAPRAHHQRLRGLATRAEGAVRRRPALRRRHPVPGHGLPGRGDRGAGAGRRAPGGGDGRARPRPGRRPRAGAGRAGLPALAGRCRRDSHAAGVATPGGCPQHRPGRLRRVVGRRADRRQPAPGARRAVRRRARLRDSTSGLHSPTWSPTTAADP